MVGRLHTEGRNIKVGIVLIALPFISYDTLNEVVKSSLPTTSILNEAWITDLIEHPIKIKAPTDLAKPPEIPLLLTKKERKKLRRQNRQEAQKERQERARLGLEKPPEPKVCLSFPSRYLWCTLLCNACGELF